MTRILILLSALLLGCVDPVKLSLTAEEFPLILEGNLTTNPSAPDTIRLSRTYPADGNYYRRKGVSATLWIEESGSVDTLIQLSLGVYVTNQLQGAIGKTYTLGGILPDGTTITSSPELMLPAGTIDSIYHELTTYRNPDTGVDEPGVNIFINATLPSTTNHRQRWKVYGTYVYISDPSLIQNPAPLACAAGCVCCTCWASEREDLPLVLDPDVLAGTTLNHVFVKFIPVNGFTFYEKYRVEVVQVELSKEVHEFYTAIRKQMQNAASLFQPPFFSVQGNVASNGATRVNGVFYAAEEARLVKYIPRSEVPYPGTTIIAGDCRAVIGHSTNVAPPFWQ